MNGIYTETSQSGYNWYTKIIFRGLYNCTPLQLFTYTNIQLYTCILVKLYISTLLYFAETVNKPGLKAPHISKFLFSVEHLQTFKFTFILLSQVNILNNPFCQKLMNFRSYRCLQLYKIQVMNRMLYGSATKEKHVIEIKELRENLGKTKQILIVKLSKIKLLIEMMFRDTLSNRIFCILKSQTGD